jgi:hypothetical protein
VQAVVVHHTVDRNDYTAAESPALIRAIHAYHVRGRGFDDIGYHFLVDRFGQVFEGRRGVLGPKPVLGAHSAGFNTATIGVAMLGEFTSTAPSDLVLESVARVGAWAADRWRFDPRSTVQLTSKGSNRHPAGSKPRVSRMPGHRDLVATACPGNAAYPTLGDIRARAFRHLAPYFTDVRTPTAPVHGGAPGTIAARLTAPASWTVRVTTLLDLVVAEQSGTGTAPALTFDGRLLGVPLPPGDYTWTMTADDGVHGPSDPVSGTVSVGLF